MQLLKKYYEVEDDSKPWIDGIYVEQILFYSLHKLIRSFIIAVRYGSCSDLRFIMLKEEPQSVAFVMKDLIG